MRLCPAGIWERWGGGSPLYGGLAEAVSQAHCVGGGSHTAAASSSSTTSPPSVHHQWYFPSASSHSNFLRQPGLCLLGRERGLGPILETCVMTGAQVLRTPLLPPRCALTGSGHRLEARRLCLWCGWGPPLTFFLALSLFPGDSHPPGSFGAGPVLVRLCLQCMEIRCALLLAGVC